MDASPPASRDATRGPVTAVDTHVRLPFQYYAGRFTARFLRAIREEGRIMGVRCTECGMVLVPPRITCGQCWADTGEWIAVADRGVVTTFVVVNVPFYGQKVEIPYVLAHVLLDGADTSIMHLVQGLPPGEVRMGMRVGASWKPPVEREGSLTDVRCFRPTGEPDEPLERFIDKL
jgi:uncharacterized OB-fold protein